ncbi:MAG: hypothetical protein JNL70_11730 [Saprospiraceae bacterium]|nr:hypothetical protein [Saprospiraceae bacterium]
MSSYKNLLLQREESLSEFKFYGIEPQSNAQAVMLDIRLGNGNSQAFAYSYLTKVNFNPSEGIQIFAVDMCILLRGRNLNAIYSYLLMHRLTYIQENIGELDEVAENDVFVESIEVRNLKDMELE